MKCYVACVLLLVTLDFIWSADVKWEVINDVDAEDDDKVTQQELLTREGLLPYVKPNPRPRAVVIKEYVDKKVGKDKAAAPPKSGAAQKAIPAPALLHGPKAPERGGKDAQNDFRGEDLLPLGVPHGNQRHLLQVSPPLQGPHLPAAVESQRLREKSLFDNLSEPCRDAADEDCLFDIESYVSDKNVAKLVTETASQAERREHPEASVQSHPRYKRQASPGTNTEESGTNTEESSTNAEDSSTNTEESGTNTDESGTNTEEGSGIFSSEELYEPEATIAGAGVYRLEMNLTIPADNLTDSEIERITAELEKDLAEKFKNMSGFDPFELSGPLLINGSLIYTVETTFNGSDAAGDAGENANLEDYIFDLLNNSLIPSLNNISIPGVTINELDVGIVEDLLTVFYDYCQSENPCADAGPEYDQTRCINNGFMSGICPHKCTDYPCQNDALCMLDSNFDPFCNCGDLYTGQYCNETEAAGEEGLDTGETVGVVAASVIVVLGGAGCLGYLCICWRRNGEVNFTYYEDVGTAEEASDPTMGSFLIDRPIISIDVFRVDPS